MKTLFFCEVHPRMRRFFLFDRKGMFVFFLLVVSRHEELYSYNTRLVLSIKYCLHFRVSLTCACAMYLRLFPLDKQTCNLDVASCKYPACCMGNKKATLVQRKGVVSGESQLTIAICCLSKVNYCVVCLLTSN